MTPSTQTKKKLWANSQVKKVPGDNLEGGNRLKSIKVIESDSDQQKRSSFFKGKNSGDTLSYRPW